MNSPKFLQGRNPIIVCVSKLPTHTILLGAYQESSRRDWPRTLMADIEFNEADERIFEALEDGRNVPANLADELGYSRQYVQNRIKRLREHGFVSNIGRGVYELVEEDSNDSQ